MSDHPPTVPILRATPDDGFREAQDLVAQEEPLEIRLVTPRHTTPHTLSITMRTPGDDAALAVGFLFCENILKDPSDLLRTQRPPLALAGAPSNTIDIHLARDPGPAADSRNFYMTSSCGVCGKSSIQALQSALPRCPPPSANAALQVPIDLLTELPRLLRQAQSLFDATGGLHAAALFSPTGELLLLREDVGRHNALDKLIGTLFLQGQLPASNLILLLSGRTSFELVQKAAMAGIPLVAAVGAPSSLAVQTAQSCGITLVGFLRDRRANIYSHPHRIVPAATAALT